MSRARWNTCPPTQPAELDALPDTPPHPHALTPLALRRRSEKKWADRFEFHQMDITKEPAKLKALIAQCDTVVNLAAICNPSEYIKQPVNTIRSNYNDAQARAHRGTRTRQRTWWRLRQTLGGVGSGYGEVSGASAEDRGACACSRLRAARGGG